ncbi:hypothetical protein R5R35_010748 [Gryllus longicercus]|uniref:C2H2-type domain-containing protein n=1 Tax=Gryllus longicercus TaxID=2509291 RepID=A0AAN9Z0P8_9ORTH
MLQHSKEKCNNWSCTVCGQVFSNPGLLLSHSSAHETAIACQICDKSFLSQNALQIHLKTHFGEAKKVFKCNICSLECPSLSRLQAHRRCHTGERPYTCGQCHRKFKRRQAVKKHIQVVHNSASLQYHKCSHCPKMFNSSGNLVRHYLRVHCQVRRFICGVCGSRFSQNQDLRRHFKVSHEIEMPNINGSDRKALREIYVIPDIDDLSETNPHAIKIRAIVAEEKAKFNRLSELLANRMIDKEDPSTESMKELIQSFSNKGGEETVGVLEKSTDDYDVGKKGQKSSCSELAGGSPAEHYDFRKPDISHSSEDKLYLCEYCNRNFPGENEYMEHIAERSKSYMCKQCSSVFCDQIHLNDHMSSEHNILQSNIAVNDLSSGNYLKHIHNLNDVQIIHSMSNVSNELQDPANLISNNDIDSSKSGLSLPSSGDLSNISTTLNINGIILQNVIIQSTPTVLQSVPLGFQNQEIVNTTQMTPVVTFSSPAVTPIDNHSFLNVNDHSLSVSTCMDSTNSVIDPETIFDKANQKILVPAVNYTVDEVKHNGRGENIQNMTGGKELKIITNKYPDLNDVKINESKETKKINCKHCGEKFHSSSSLNRHKKSHSASKEFGCPDCAKRFSERFNLKTHMMTHTGERPYQCEDCGKQLRYRKDVLDHKRMHLGERPFECEECGRKFIRQRELNRHKVIHSGEKKYECPICGKMFGRLDQLRNGHLLTHSDSNSCPKHICSICNKSFKLKSQLKQHKTLHTGLKPYKCELCEKSFALGVYLKAHMQCHKKRDTYVQCPKCPRRFTSEATLQVHDRTFHSRLKKGSKTSEIVKKESHKIGDDTNLPNENIGIQRQLDKDIEIHDVDLSMLDANNCNAVIFLQMVPEELSFDVDS